MKHTIKDAFGKTHEFDYTEAYKYAFDIYSKNSRALIMIESNLDIRVDIQLLHRSIESILKMENPRISQYIPSGWVIDIYKKNDKGDKEC